MNDNDGLTPTQKRILDRLSDGRPHACVDMLDLLNDSEGARYVSPEQGKNAVRSQITALRKWLCQANDDRIIICEFFHRRPHWRMVKSLVPGLRHGPSIAL